MRTVALAERVPADTVIAEETPSSRPDLHKLLPARLVAADLAADYGAALAQRAPDRPAYAEEIFAPVVPVVAFRDLDEAVRGVALRRGRGQPRRVHRGAMGHRPRGSAAIPVLTE